MNRIRLLPEQVANQIAAGEVVERPASVVKELVENALDARATRITVEIQAGGRSLIRVTDDGVGMSRDDALLSFERHATSKIQSADDLASIATFGFRGEALPSIASVCRLALMTRERETNSPEGTEVVIHGGRVIHVKAAGCAPGTSVEARQLFYNLPARRKFLRSEETERAHVQHYLTLAALAHPEVGLSFVQDQRLIWQLPPLAVGPGSAHDPLQERLRALYGTGLNLLALDFQAVLPKSDEAEPPDCRVRIWGFIGAPGVSRATREEQHLFVNRRPVENRGLNYALLEGYHTSLMKGRYPVCCLFLEIDPAEVDVNIHPAKREIKFHREFAVRRLMTDAVRQALLRFHLPPVEPSPRPASVAPTAHTRTDQGAAPNPPAQAGFDVGSRAAAPAPAPPAPPRPESSAPHQATAAPAVPPTQSVSTAATVASPPSSVPTAQLATFGSGIVPLLQVPLRVLGVIGKLYVVMESDRGLVLLDQHAAHERILFEQMLRRLEQGNAPSQRLLLPETIELSPRDSEFLRGQLSSLGRMGVSLSEFGARTFLLDGLPPFVKASDPRRFLLELIDELRAAGSDVNSWRLGEQMIAKTVCRHAVKANDPLTPAEIEKLIEDLRQCQMPYTCPHGRPTLVEMSFRDLEKKFGRIQG